MSDKPKQSVPKWLVWGLGFYLCFAYLIFGLVCYLAWQRSELFYVIGWSWSHPQAETFQRLIYSLCAGGLGAVSYNLWGLFYHYCDQEDFKSVYNIWYVLGPVSGSLLGIATYSIIIGGLFVLGESVTLRSNWAIFALCYITGFGSIKVHRKLNAIANEIFKGGVEPESRV